MVELEFIFNGGTTTYEKDINCVLLTRDTIIWLIIMYKYKFSCKIGGTTIYLIIELGYNCNFSWIYIGEHIIF